MMREEQKLEIMKGSHPHCDRVQSSSEYDILENSSTNSKPEMSAGSHPSFLPWDWENKQKVIFLGKVILVLISSHGGVVLSVTV